MKQLIIKLFFIPFVSFGLTLLTAAVLGTIYDTTELRELLNGTSALPIYYVWLVILYPLVLLKHFLKR